MRALRPLRLPPGKPMLSHQFDETTSFAHALTALRDASFAYLKSQTDDHALAAKALAVKLVEDFSHSRNTDITALCAELQAALAAQPEAGDPATVDALRVLSDIIEPKNLSMEFKAS